MASEMVPGCGRLLGADSHPYKSHQGLSGNYGSLGTDSQYPWALPRVLRWFRMLGTDSWSLWASELLPRCRWVAGYRLSNLMGLREGSQMTVNHWMQLSSHTRTHCGFLDDPTSVDADSQSPQAAEMVPACGQYTGTIYQFPEPSTMVPAHGQVTM